jgi:hypothetical protein
MAVGCPFDNPGGTRALFAKVRMAGETDGTVPSTPILRIPAEDRKAIEALARAPSELIEAIAAAAQTEEPALYTRDLFRRIRTKIATEARTIDLVTVDSVLDVLLTLFAAREANVSRAAEFPDSVAGSESLNLSPTERQTLRERIDRLMRIRSLAITAKAVGVLFEHPNTYHSSRIVTDFRYLFEEDVSTEPEYGVINHLLRITAHTTTGLVESYFGLDTLDLAELQSVIERALKKQETIARALRAKGTKILSP